MEGCLPDADDRDAGPESPRLRLGVTPRGDTQGDTQAGPLGPLDAYTLPQGAPWQLRPHFCTLREEKVHPPPSL